MLADRPREAGHPAQAITPMPPTVQITDPGGGAALQGLVTISGSSQASGFQSAEVDFAYQNDPTSTWFVIAQSAAPANAGVLAQWDTTTISDGIYRLRLRVVLSDGQVLEDIVAGVRVRNYTPIETSTPDLSSGGVTGTEQPQSTATATPPGDFIVTPIAAEALPTNPAEITARDLRRSVFAGALAAAGAVILFAGYIGLKSLRR